MDTNQLLNLSTAQLRRAADIKERIDELSEELSGILGGTAFQSTAAAPATRKGKRRQMSAEARQRIAEAQRARWAKTKSKQGSAGPSGAVTSSGRKRRSMSPEARKKIAEAAKARWAKIRAAKG